MLSNSCKPSLLSMSVVTGKDAANVNALLPDCASASGTNAIKSRKRRNAFSKYIAGPRAPE